MPPDASALSRMLRAWRARAMLTQEELASRTGLGVRTIRRLESDGLRRPHTQSLRRIADALELSESERTQLTAAEQSGSVPFGPPRQLPVPPQLFTGRAAELADLDRITDASAVVITAIDGMAGIGKTALAVHIAHRLSGRYPDGQLFVDLHGYTRGMAPVPPGEALDRMLRALGVAGERIPAGLDERAALYRSRLADRRMLVLRDNAATETQVAPLLPGAAGCLVLVTSRRRLAGLDRTHTISLDTLPLPDAVALFTRTAGEARVADQPPALVAETVELCGRLPLAIRIAAARLRAHPVWTVEHLAGRLRDGRHRLAELSAGERSVTAALDLSYRQLAGDAQRVYRLLGLHQGPQVDAPAAAALAGTTVARARRMLDELVETHLLQEPTIGRCAFHDLVRVHAAGAAREESEPDRRAAVGRLLDYYRYAAAVAMDAAYPYERERRPRVPPAAPSPHLSDPGRAVGWLDTELPNLLGAASHAAEHGWPEHIAQLSVTLHRHLRIGGRYRDAEAIHRLALTVARGTGQSAGELAALLGLGDIHAAQGRYEHAAGEFAGALELARTTGHRAGELDALLGLGHIHRMQGRQEHAIDHHERALTIARGLGDLAGQLDGLLGLGRVHLLRGRHAQAIDHYQQALAIARDTGNRPGELKTLTSLGDAHLLMGGHADAIHHHRQALAIARDTGNQPGELDALRGIGRVHRMRGDHAQAIDHYRQALRIARGIGSPAGELSALTGIGDIHRLAGRHSDAIDHYQQVLDLAQRIGNRNWQFEATHGLGRLHHAAGRPRDAVASHEQALAIATDLGQPDDQARAHDGLAHAHRALDQPEQARQHWRQALDILSRLAVTYTEDEETTAEAIRSHLAGLDRQERSGTSGQ
jgi:tetratricopeptide (TPR) repeat protein/transcriptional regulator with XRE-family HTH domain